MDLDTPLGRFSVFPEGTITRALQNGQWWDDHLKPLIDSVPSGGWAIDIGAHFGWFTRYLSHRFSVIAVEPNPAAFQLLLRNVYQDPPYSSRVHCWPVAAFDTICTLTYDPRNDPTDVGGFSFTGIQGSRRVAAVRLDFYVPLLADVRVIKCDAQGADLRALRGLQSTIERCRPLILFEWEEGLAAWQGDRWQDYLDFFEELNYTVERITDRFWVFVATPK